MIESLAPESRRSNIRARFGFYLGCNTMMLAGMFLAEWFGRSLAGNLQLSWTFSAMAAGMAVGMAAWMLLHERARKHRRSPGRSAAEVGRTTAAPAFEWQ
ncbi:MAG: hypothetical protein WD036_10325 [Bauldia sp.]